MGAPEQTRAAIPAALVELTRLRTLLELARHSHRTARPGTYAHACAVADIEVLEESIRQLEAITETEGAA